MRLSKSIKSLFQRLLRQKVKVAGILCKADTVNQNMNLYTADELRKTVEQANKGSLKMATELENIVHTGPAVETFRLLQRIAELLHEGELSLTTVSYILDTSLPEVKQMGLDWCFLLPCHVNPITKRYCSEDVKMLLKGDNCYRCREKEICRDRIEEPTGEPM